MDHAYTGRHLAPEVEVLPEAPPVETGTQKWRRIQYAPTPPTSEERWFGRLFVVGGLFLGAVAGWAIDHAIEVMTR